MEIPTLCEDCGIALTDEAVAEIRDAGWPDMICDDCAINKLTTTENEDMKFTDATKEESKFSGNYFNYGVHKVKLGLIETGETESGKEYIELTVLGENEEEDTARVWFSTEKAANYSFNTLSQIAVHQGKNDEEKSAIRAAVINCGDTDEIVKLFNDKFVGTAELWFTVYPSPDRTYQAADGSTKKSIDKNVYGYEPKLREDLMPKQDTTAPVTGNETQADIAAGIPDAWK
jgi:hypothetical protein